MEINKKILGKKITNNENKYNGKIKENINNYNFEDCKGEINGISDGGNFWEEKKIRENKKFKRK